MNLLGRLNLTWQSVAALALLLGFAAYILHLRPDAITGILGLLAPGGVLALAAPAVVAPKPPEAP